MWHYTELYCNKFQRVLVASPVTHHHTSQKSLKDAKPLRRSDAAQRQQKPKPLILSFYKVTELDLKQEHLLCL